MNLGDNFVQEGLANRITPFTTNKPGARNFDTERTYHNVMTRFKFGNLSHRGLYIDETTMRMCYTHRRLLAQLALQLLAEQKNDKALKVLQKAEKEIPEYNVRINYMSGGLDMARAYALLGQRAKARQYFDKCFTDAAQYATWYLSLNNDRFLQSQEDCLRNIMIMHQVSENAAMTDKKLAAGYDGRMKIFYNSYRARGGQMPQE